MYCKKEDGLLKSQQTDFSKGRVERAILAVAIPMTLAQVLNLLYTIVDRIYIGRIEGSGALALTGVGVCFPIIMMVTAFANLFGSGGAPLATIMRGQGDNDEAAKIMNTSFVLLLATGALLTVVGIAFHRPLLYLFGASDATFSYASEYIVVYLLGSIAVMVTLGMNPFINSQGFGRVGMLTIVLGAGLNIVLDPLFIFALDMGVRGAALATILSQCASCIWVLRFLTGPKTVMRISFKGLKLRAKRIKRILGLGLTGFTIGFTNSLVQAVCNITLQQFGGDIYVGVMTVLGSIREMFILPVYGLANGASPVLSFNYGAKAFDRVKQAIRFTTIVCFCFTLAAWGLVFFFPSFFIGIFTNDAALIAAAVPSLRIYFVGFLFMSFQFVAQNIFVALGKAKRAVFFSLLRKAFIVTPLTLLLPHLFNLGVNGVFLAEPISNLIGGVACYATMLLTIMPELKARAAESPLLQ